SAQVRQAYDDVAPGLLQGARLQAGDGVYVSREPGDDLRGEVDPVLGDHAEDPDLDAVDLLDDRLLDHALEGVPGEVDVGVEERQAHGAVPAELPARHAGQDVHAQVELVVPER